MLNVVNQDMWVFFGDPLGPDSEWNELIRTFISCTGTTCVHLVVLFITVQQTNILQRLKIQYSKKEKNV